MKNKSQTSSTVNTATREGNARSGHCASALFASASSIPAVVSEALPDDEFCTLDDAFKAFRKIEKQLLLMKPTNGKHFVFIKVKDARNLILTLVLADTSVGLSKELDPTPAIAADQSLLRDRVQVIKKVINDAQCGTVSYEDIRKQLESLPNQALTNNVLSLIEQRAPMVQSMAGTIDASIGKFAVKHVASELVHQLHGRVSGGYDEQAGSITLEVTELINADPRLFNIGSRITVKVTQEEHRVSLLLAQLAKVQVRVWLNVPRIPITMSSTLKTDISSDLQRLEILEHVESMEKFKSTLIQQFNLEI